MRDMAATFVTSIYRRSDAAMAARLHESNASHCCRVRHVCLPLDVHKNGTAARRAALNDPTRQIRTRPTLPSGGARRNSLSPVASTQQAAYIHYSRGHIEITNLEGLGRTSCESYAHIIAVRQVAGAMLSGFDCLHTRGIVAARIYTYRASRS